MKTYRIVIEQHPTKRSSYVVRREELIAAVAGQPYWVTLDAREASPSFDYAISIVHQMSYGMQERER